MNKRRIAKAIKDIQLPILLSIVYVLFHGLFEKLITKYLVDPILSYSANSILVDSVAFVIIISLTIIIYNKIRIKYFIGLRFLTITLLINSFYLYYRLDGTVWDFTKSHYISFIAYLDIIPLYGLGILAIFCSSRIKKVKNYSNQGFYHDNPLGTSGKDFLNRENLAKSIAIELSNTYTMDSSFALGVSSEWGFGKTSFIDLIERNLDRRENIIIKFNPWVSHDSKSIIKDFFNLLNVNLSKYNSDISMLINKYSEILISLDDSVTKKILKSVLINPDQQNDSSIEFQSIDDAIKNIDKKIFIFIDDLDRLNKYEITEVIKLIRNSASFSNTVFIVTYDRNYVINALKEINNYYPEYFLEKIFQIELQLPNFDEQIIRNKLYELLNPRLEPADQTILNDSLLKKNNSFGFNAFYLNTLKTLRDVTRFANSFLIAYSFLKGEVVLNDLLNLEALRLKFPGVYKLIFFRPEDFLETKPNEYKKTNYTLKKEKILKQKEEFEIVTIKDYLEKNYSTVGLPVDQVEDVITMLHSLFPEPDNIFLKDEGSLLSVKNPISLNRYSHYRLMDTDLSEIEFSKYRTKSQSEFQEKITEWVNMNLGSDLRRKFENVSSYSDKEDFENIIKAIFFFAHIQGQEKSNIFSTGFNYDNLFAKISGYDSSISSLYYNSKSEFSNFVLEIFKTAPSPYLFEAEFIYYILDKYSISYNFIVPKETFEEIRLMYFKSYCNEATSLDNNIWELYGCCDIINPVQQENNSYQIHKLKNPEATKYFIEFIRDKALDDFIIAVIGKRPFDENLYKVSELIPQMFGSFKEFETFLKTFDLTNYKYLEEFLTFYEKFSSTNYEKYVEFKFEKISINNK